MRTVVRLFDRLLRRVYGVFEFSADPTCLLRLQVTQTGHAIALPDGLVPAGASVLQLHLWNEHIPSIPPQGPDLAWALQTRRLMMASLHAVARQMTHDPSLAGVQAVGGVTSILSPDDPAGGERIMRRAGFTVFPCRHPLGRFGEFWENLYAWAIMWTFNAVSLRRRKLLRLRRAELWMSANEFLQRYGDR